MPKAAHSIRTLEETHPVRDLQQPETPVSVAPNGIDEHAIAVRAYELWQDRGAPIGSPEVDWFRAQEELNSLQQLVTHG